MAILNFQQAREAVIDRVRRARVLPPIEKVSLIASRGRVLAAEVLADRDFPPFPRSTRDGYAVRSEDVVQVPTLLEEVGQARAGTAYAGTVGAGQCVEIMTGAPVPEGADAVVMVEHTAKTGESVTIQRRVAKGENVVPQGSEAPRNGLLLAPGRRIGYAEIAMLAAVGRQSVSVYRKPRVVILPTGDEVVELDVAPGPHQIRNSNSCSLQAQVANAGGEPMPLGIGPDREDRLGEMIAEGLQADLLLLSGGVSVGKFDLVGGVLANFGAEFVFEGVAIQPGRPLVFGRAKGTFFFGLPGNPLSTMLTFELFARPAVALLAGEDAAPLFLLKARLATDLRRKPGLTAVLPAVLSGTPLEPVVTPVQWRGSGDLASLGKANCYLVVPENGPRR